MSRALLIIQSKVDRERAVRWVRLAPAGTRLEFRETKRTIPQNDRMYAMLTDIARQRTHCGRRYTVDQWKCIFMHALGQEVEFIPSLNEKTFIPLVYRSSELSKAEMSALIELMLAWGAENGVQFHDRQEAAA
jgi:NinB protein